MAVRVYYFAIACFKLGAVASRGTKKDFVDLYYIMKKGLSLATIFNLMDKKYKNKDLNKQHFLKSLVCFEDAENDPEPNMLVSDYSWEKTKEFFVKQVRNY